MTQLEELAAIITEQLAKDLPPARSPAEQQILMMIKKASYAAFIIGYKTARDSISKSLKKEGIVTDELAARIASQGEEGSVNETVSQD